MQKVQVGDVEVTALIDGNVRLPADMLFPEISQDDWAPFKPEFIDADGTLPLSLGAFLVRSGDHLTLVDTGVGVAATAFQLPSGGVAAGLQAQSVRPEDVNLVIITHMHADHVGGATVESEGTFRPLYPRARYCVDRMEWEYWLNDAQAKADPSMPPDLVAACAKPLQENGVLELTDGIHQPAPHLTVIPARGHTPGHCSVLVESEGKRLMIIGDAAHCPAQVCNPAWSIYAGVDKAEERRSRTALFDTIEREGMLVGAGHYFRCNFGRFVRRDGQRVFEPLEQTL